MHDAFCYTLSVAFCVAARICRSRHPSGSTEKEGGSIGKIDATVKRETLYIAVWELLLSVLMEAVFLIIRKWDLTVLLGNLLGGGIAVLNFFLLGLTVQKAVDKEEKEAKDAMKASQAMRTLMMFVTAALGALLPVFNIFATLIPLLFPRIAIAFRPKFDRKDEEPPESGDKGGDPE